MSKRYVLLALLSGLLTWPMAAQQVDFNMVVQPLETKARDFSEYLVQLAWLNSPESQIVQDQGRNARDASRMVHKEWMRDAQTTFNLNESNLRSQSTAGAGSNVFFPRYNVSVALNLYNILSQKQKNSIGNRDIKIADHKTNQRKLEIRNKTLSRYASFKLAKQLLKLRTLAEQDVYANYILIQQLYKTTDEKNFEEYTHASSAYYAAQEARMKAESEVQIAKLDVEEMIGIKWELIQHPAKEE
jgi:hypothetical protein